MVNQFREHLIAGWLISIIFVYGNFVMPKRASAQPGTTNSTTSYGYYTGDRVPGNPANEVKLMNRIYHYLQVYRQRHDGHYPTARSGAGSFIDDMFHHLMEYGFKSPEEMLQSFTNPDNQYVDDPFVRKHPSRSITTSFQGLRPNSRPIGAPLLVGTHDLLAATSIYFHPNDPDFDIGREVANPVGYYMVLWDDGNIEKIAYDQVFYMPVTTSKRTAYSVVYPAQAGAPWNCVTYAEMHINSYVHATFTIPPIGYPLATGQIEPQPDNGGIESFVTLTRLFERKYDREQIWDSLGHQVKDFTLQEVADGAAKIDFPLQQKVLSLDELQKLHTPAILFLNDSGRIVTMSTIDDNHVIIYDRGMTLNVPRAELEKRYGGNALIAASVNAPSSLVTDQPIRQLEFSSKEAEVTQNIKITNNGAKPVSLIIERPLCGITYAELSQDQIESGESVNLELHFKWRHVLPGDKQSTFVTLKTDDPVQPRLQLGFDLKLTEGK